ncbi:MAG: AMP-binding protein [Archaeoglobales archaeon]|nr:AMP-binding protein [Archaeoglobales archaeon]
MENTFWDAEIETISRDELEKLQFKRLKYQLNRCYSKSYLYKRKFKEAGIHPSDIVKLSDLQKIPFLYKGDLRQEQAEKTYTGYLVTEKRIVEVYPTSGSTGKPVLNFWTEFDRDYITHLTARTLWSMGLREGQIIQNSFKYENWAVGIAIHRAVQMIGGMVIPVGGGRIPKQIEYILNIKPNVITALPSFALELGYRLRDMGYSGDGLSLEFGAFGGEPGASIPSIRKKLEELLGIDAYDYYGLMEIAPTFASECKEKSGLHWSEDCHLIEVVDPKTGEPVSEGELGVLVITHLVKEACPLIRYWTGDLTKIELERCGCGRTHARSPGGIIGRMDDLIVYHGVKVFPSEVEELLYNFPEVRNVLEVSQDDSGLIVELSLNCTSMQYELVEKKLSEYLTEYFEIPVRCKNISDH